MERKKLLSDTVLFPRTINKGNEPEHIDREQFTAEMRGVEGMGETWLITQNGFPHVVSQVVTTKNESEFDLLLGRAIANHIHAEWVKGCTDFFVLISGWNDDIKWQQATCDRQMAEIFAIEALAAKWWYCYREDIIKGQEGEK